MRGVAALAVALAGQFATAGAGDLGAQESGMLERLRAECPLVAAGAGAIECDDYRVTFSLPAVTRMNVERTLSFVYNTDHARDTTVQAFGNGWWPVGYERLDSLDDGSLLWFNGGGVRRYTRSGAKWVAETRGRPDSITRSGAGYTRHLHGGAKVKYATAGHHVATVSRTGNETRFVYDTVDAVPRLRAVLLPPSPAPTNDVAYALYYDDGRLERIADIGGGTTTLTTAARERGYVVTSVTNAVGLRTSFEYSGNVVTGVTDARGAVTTISYSGLKVSGVEVRAGGERLVMAYDPAGDGEGHLDGPRTDIEDVTRFWTTSWGAMSAVEDAEGGRTSVSRDDPSYPGLVTGATYPNGYGIEVGYDGDGRVSSTTTTEAGPRASSGTPRGTG